MKNVPDVGIGDMVCKSLVFGGRLVSGVNNIIYLAREEQVHIKLEIVGSSTRQLS